ncbi:uncharacterized protein BJX67DRAFT_385176 [Aspergillus lucknowensis]|uniref:DUF7924 domain-containing protein n=1 Tax=Aspergillus lucknowensis TaxID=176173 RepID=A0ABR4LEI5_9EURO
MPYYDHSCAKSTAWLPEPAFWDNLSKIWLSKLALNELQRRESSDKPTRPQRPRSKSVTNVLRRFGPDRLAELKELAASGGPDISDLRDYPPPRNLGAPSLEPTELASTEIEDSAGVEERVGESSSSASMSTSNKSPIKTRRRGGSRYSLRKTLRKPVVKAPIKKMCRKRLRQTFPHRTKGVTAYDPNFQQHLVDNKVYPSGFRDPNGRQPEPPKNLKSIRARLPRSRRSLLPLIFDRLFKDFEEVNDAAQIEQTVMESVIPLLEGTTGTRERSGGQRFENLAPITGVKLAAATPGHFYGSHPSTLDRQIRDELSDKIVPSKQRHRLIVPNFFLEVKGPDGSTNVVKRQACYNGALGARGIHTLRTYREENENDCYDSNAYTVSSTYESGPGTLTLYATHPQISSDPNGRPEYVMTKINSWSITGNPESFRAGVSAYRNAVDWAREQREAFVEQANTKVSRKRKRSPEQQGEEES